MEQEKIKLLTKIRFYAMMGLVGFINFLTNPIATLAAGAKAKGVKAKDALGDVGINTSTNVEAAGLYEDLNSIVYIIMAVGGIWTIACLIFAGMRLSAAQGNPQARTQGLIGIAMAALGLFIIVKAYDIAGIVASMGG